MKRGFVTITAILAFLCLTAGQVTAADNADMYLERAEDVLHHSCASLVEESEEDSTQIEMVVSLMVAVSLINREIDISEFAQTDEEIEALKVKFVGEVKKSCEEDSDALLAGVVDRAVVYALSTE